MSPWIIIYVILSSWELGNGIEGPNLQFFQKVYKLEKGRSHVPTFPRSPDSLFTSFSLSSSLAFGNRGMGLKVQTFIFQKKSTNSKKVVPTFPRSHDPQIVCSQALHKPSQKPVHKLFPKLLPSFPQSYILFVLLLTNI